MMTADLLPSYPEGEYLEGNFVQAYLDGYNFYDRFIVKLFGNRGIEVDKLTPITDAAIEWTYDVNAIVFTHLNEWAKMYSANIKDYEPLWNVDGTVKTTYGATKETSKYGPTKDTNIYGEQKDTTVEAQRTNTLGGGTDTHNEFKTTYPDATERKTDKSEDIIAERTNTQGGGTDTLTRQSHTDTHETVLHQDEKDTIQHIDEERRTGNIGVTSSMSLVEQENALRTKWVFFKMIFRYILQEMGAIYYEWL